MIPDYILPQESRHKQCSHRPFLPDIFIPYHTSTTAATEDDGRLRRFTRFSSSDAAQVSSNRNWLRHVSIGFSTLQMRLGVYHHGYGNLIRLHTAGMLINQLPITLLITIPVFGSADGQGSR
jgi:hypothetical protein